MWSQILCFFGILLFLYFFISSYCYVCVYLPKCFLEFRFIRTTWQFGLKLFQNIQQSIKYQNTKRSISFSLFSQSVSSQPKLSQSTKKKGKKHQSSINFDCYDPVQIILGKSDNPNFLLIVYKSDSRLDQRVCGASPQWAAGVV